MTKYEVRWDERSLDEDKEVALVARSISYISLSADFALHQAVTKCNVLRSIVDAVKEWTPYEISNIRVIRITEEVVA